MGAGMLRIGDQCTGHGCFPPTALIDGSSNVFVNGIGAATTGSQYEPHSCGKNNHQGTAGSGAGSVFVNGKSAYRTGDPRTCGGTGGQGSTNVFG